jgi:large repetitive protein
MFSMLRRSPKRNRTVRLVSVLILATATALVVSGAAPDAVADTADGSFPTFSGVITTTAGQPAAGVIVQLGSNQATTGADGSFTVSAAPGQYSMQLNSNGGNGLPEFSISTPPVDLSGGNVTQDMTLPVTTMNITVLDSNGNPVPGAGLTPKTTTTPEFQLYPGAEVIAQLQDQGGTADSSGVISYPTFLGAASFTSYLAGPTGSPTTQVTVPAVTASPTNTTLDLEPAGQAPAITSAAATSARLREPFSFTVTTTGDPAPSVTETGPLPAGVTFTDDGDGTATLAGTPAAGTAGTYPLTITASNGAGSPATQSLTLTVTATASAPAFAGRPLAGATFGVAFSRTIQTTGYPVPKITKTGSLPPGVTFTDNGDGTATLAGTPDKSASGPYYLILTAKNTAGTATWDFTLLINTAPAIKKVPATTGSTGDPLSVTITSTGYGTPALTESGALPAGVAFTDNGDGTATIAGSPAAGSGGSYPVTVTATNGTGTASQALTITIKQPPAITSPDTATITAGTPFTFTVTATGYPAPAITSSGKLPKGITYDKATATFSGTAAAGTAGTYAILITAANISGKTPQALTLTVTTAAAPTSQQPPSACSRCR